LQLLLDIGKAIIDGIVMGLGNIFDSIMMALFPEEWGKVKQKQGTQQEIEEQSNGEPIESLSGEQVSVAEAQERVQQAGTAEDVRILRQEFGLDQQSGFDAYKYSFLSSLFGVGSLGRNAYGNLNLNTAMRPEEVIANALGLTYSNGNWYDGNGVDITSDTDISRIVNEAITAINEASNQDELNAAIEKLNEFLRNPENGVNGNPIDTSDANTTARQKEQEQIEKNAKAEAEAAKSAKSSSDAVKNANSTLVNSITGLANTVEDVIKEIKKNLPKDNALGGRFDKEMNNMTVAEDGTEYIIPITKPARAFELINQMLNEMGSSAVAHILRGFGFGQSGTVGASMGSIGTAMSGLVMNNTFNIHAPVNINVTSNGASAQEVGTQAYNLAERHLVKTLMGVYA